MADIQLLDEDLFTRILIDPIKRGSNELFILSGYASASMVTRHFDQIRKITGEKISLDLIVGMTGRDGIDRSNLLGFQAIPRQTSGNTFNCAFTTRGTSDHSKIFVWCNEEGPVEAYLGSSNYTQFGFGIGNLAGRHKEVCVEVNPQLAFDKVLAAAKGTIGYLNQDIPSYVDIFDRPENNAPLGTSDSEQSQESSTVLLPLVQTRAGLFGKPHEKAGLNWGQREGREPNQAYIPVPSKVARLGFFPEKGVHFQIHTDDGEVFLATIAQENDKAIETPSNNSLLGKYFRKRLGLELGVFVDAEDLLRYGANAVRVRKKDELVYELEFRPGILVQDQP